MRLKKLNKKGFSLVEIIAAVAILGILSVIGIVSVNNIIQKGKEEHYKSAEKTLKLSAESYAQANRSYLPKNVGDKVKITLRTLVENNYTEEITDYYDNTCDLDNSYVQIYKYSKTDYSYLTYLNCPEWSNVEENNNLKPTISIIMTDPTDNTVKKTTAKTTITDDNKILSYSITIYKNGTEVYTTGNVEANYEKEVTKTKDISKYTPGTIKVVAKATNIYGQTETTTVEKTYTDRQGPACIISPEDSTRDNDDWITTSRKITVGCDDGEEGSGCTREEFTKTFKTDMKTGIITISDKAGNTTDCVVDVYIDATAPDTCTVSHDGTKGLNDWYVTNATVTLTSNDAMSGVKYKSLTTSSTAPTSASGYNGKEEDTQTEIASVVWYGYLEDYAGNKTDCYSTSFKVDTTAPTTPSGGSISVSGSSTTATLGEVSGSDDETSGFQEYRYYVVKNDSKYPANTDSNFEIERTFTRECGKTYYAYAIAIDKAGNRSSVYLIGTAADNEDKYVKYSACTKQCDTGTQTASNECALITETDTRNCNERKCCTSTSVTYTETSTCSALCGGGNYKREAYSSYDSSVRCSSYDDYEGGECNKTGCCDESNITYGTWSSYSTCTKDCGGGLKTRSRSKTSKANDTSCGTEVETVECNTDSCCSIDSPTGCEQYHSCRIGNTFIYNKTTSGSTQYSGTVSDSQTLYLLNKTGSYYYVYVPNGGKFNHKYYDTPDYGYVYQTCIEPIGVNCEFSQCPDRG